MLVELKARFDEESNIGWARALEAAGRPRRLRPGGPEDARQDHARGAPRGRAGCAATSTWPPATTTPSPRGIYTDLGLFTCDPEIGADATELFNTLTGYSTQQYYRSLLVAPGDLRERLEALIEREIEHARRDGRRGSSSR